MRGPREKTTVGQEEICREVLSLPIPRDWGGGVAKRLGDDWSCLLGASLALLELAGLGVKPGCSMGGFWGLWPRPWLRGDNGE